MNVHCMSLQDEYYSKIAKGEKTVELRLYDEKRRSVKAWDAIIFSNVSAPDQTITVEVVALHVFDSFKELFSSLPVEACGFKSTQDYNIMDSFYSASDQALWGVVGIEFKVL